MINLKSSVGILAVAIIACHLHGKEPVRKEMATVSIPNLHTAKGERVTGFAFHLTRGRIVTVANMPIGWKLSIDNDASWNTSIDGTFMVGAAALDPNYFHKFLVIEKFEFMDVSFDITGEVMVSQGAEEERKIKVEMKDMILSHHGDLAAARATVAPAN